MESRARATPGTATALAVLLATLATPSALLTAGEETGFVTLFDGKSLDGWDAVPGDCADDWSVRDGVIVGEGSADRLAYLVWKDRELTDFELRLEYRLPGEGNSGVEIRSQGDPSGKRPFQGYHADLGHPGIGAHILGAWDFHFATRREHPCPRGTRLVIDEDEEPHPSRIPGAVTLGDIRDRDWNDVRVIARGNRFQFFINGKIASEFADNARTGRLDHGAIALQIHDRGMRVEFRNIRLRRLDAGSGASAVKDLGLQLVENPPMRVIARAPPEPPEPPAAAEGFEIRDGFRLITTLDAFRDAIKESGQRIRMRPGVYRASRVDPPMRFVRQRAEPGEGGDGPVRVQQHIFAVNGSDNWFDLRGVVLETPVSVQSRLTGRAHVADSWHVNGDGNTFEGGYFRNVVDEPYPRYRVTENEFEVCGDNNTFLDCTFVIKGSIPYGYSDYFGKGGPNFGRVDKHSFLSIEHASGTRLTGCRVFMQSFGHCVHFHDVDGARIEGCLFTGALRPTNDIFRETAGRAKEHDFHIMYRGRRPIPRDQMIPLTEDGVRSYDEVRNIAVVDTTVERLRGCFQLLCTGDVTLENVTVREAGDFGFDVSSGGRGKVTVKGCRSDIAYNPVFNLTRGELPRGAFYELTILSPREGVAPTARTSLGAICGDGCTFILHDGMERPVAAEHLFLVCGGKRPLVNSTVTNHTRARLVLSRRVRDCVIRSVGEVEDRGKDNTVVRIEPAAREASR